MTIALQILGTAVFICGVAAIPLVMVFVAAHVKSFLRGCYAVMGYVAVLITIGSLLERCK